MQKQKTELPQNLKDLYSHWRFHTILEEDGLETKAVWRDENLLKEVSWFIQERLSIWKKKMDKEMHPLTDDPILSKYKFCNVFREFDRQTIEFHTLLKPLIYNNLALWLLNMLYCRIVANEETIKNAGLLSFDTTHNERVYEKLVSMKRPMYGTPYVFPISVIQNGPTPTRELFITKHLPMVMQEVAKEVASWNKKSVYEGLQKIIPIFGYELNFHWTEVLIDLAYQYPHFVNLFDRFPCGPGAAPTLSKINPTRDPTLLVIDLARTYTDTGLTYKGQPLVLSAENWEGIACEFRKYTNLKNGFGRKRLYR